MEKLDILHVPASETITINTLAMQKRARGETVFNLSAGEPMLPIAPAIANATIKAIGEEKTHYPPIAGIPELRQAASKWMNEWYGSMLDVSNTLVVPGGKFGLFILFQALLKPGDEVIIPAPYWVSYPSMVKIFFGVPKIVTSTAKTGWKVTAKEVEKAITKKTKLLLLNNGGNPTGALYSATELKDIMAMAVKHGVLVISDEVYSGLVYDNKKYVSCGSFKEYKDNLIIIHSCSKSFAMTGLRVGFVFAAPEIVKALTGLVSQSTSGATTIAQWGALGGFQNAKKIIPKINKEMQKRRDIFMREFNKTFKQKLLPPASGLYAFISLKAMGHPGNDSGKFCQSAMEHANVAIIPGSAFGVEGYVRFSFGEDPKVLKAGINALAKYLLVT